MESTNKVDRRTFLGCAGIAGIAAAAGTFATSGAVAEPATQPTTPNLGDDVAADVAIQDLDAVLRSTYQVDMRNVEPFPAICKPAPYDYEADILVIGCGLQWDVIFSAPDVPYVYSGFKFPPLVFGRQPTLKVNKYGYRFMNEDGSWTAKARETYKQPEHRMFAIFDRHATDNLNDMYIVQGRSGACDKDCHVLTPAGEIIPGLFRGANDAGLFDFGTGMVFQDALISGGGAHAWATSWLSVNAAADEIEAAGKVLGQVIVNDPTGITMPYVGSDAATAGHQTINQVCGICHSEPSRAVIVMGAPQVRPACGTMVLSGGALGPCTAREDHLPHIQFRPTCGVIALNGESGYGGWTRDGRCYQPKPQAWTPTPAGGEPCGMSCKDIVHVRDDPAGGLVLGERDAR